MGEKDSVSKSEIEIRERLTTIEQVVKGLATSVTQHLEQWDKQWSKIDSIDDKLDKLDRDVALRFNTLDTERRMIKKFASPLWGMISGAFGGAFMKLIADKLDRLQLFNK